MLKKKMAAGVVALAMFSTLGLAACNPGGSSSDSSRGGSAAAGSIPQPDVACDIPEGNLDNSKIDTSKVEGEITFQTQGLQNDFGDFFKAKIKEFEDANPGVKINWTDQGGGAEFDQTVTAQASNCKMADVINVPSSTILALSKSNLLMDYDVKAPGIGDKFVKSIWDSTALGANDHHTALPWYFGPYITTYNKEVFKRAGLDENMPPKTMDELFEDAAKVGADGQGDYGIYGSPEWYMIAQLHGMGVNLLNADKTAFDFADNEAAIKYVTKLSELYASGAIPKDSLTGEPDPGKAYTDGNLAFGTPNASFLKSVKKNNETVYQNTGVGPFPTNPGIKPVFEGQYIGVFCGGRARPHQCRPSGGRPRRPHLRPRHPLGEACPARRQPDPRPRAGHAHHRGQRIGKDDALTRPHRPARPHLGAGYPRRASHGALRRRGRPLHAVRAPPASAPLRALRHPRRRRSWAAQRHRISTSQGCHQP